MERFSWRQVSEALLEPKTWLFFIMVLCANVGANVTVTFGPLILNGIGFNKFKTSLLNMPFGAFQTVMIFLASYCTYMLKVKSLVIGVFVLPVLAGLAVLYALPRPNEAGLLVGYYLLACLYGANPLILSWISANTAGSTKKSVVIALHTAGGACGDIMGPLMFHSSDAPLYHRGLLTCIGIFAAQAGSILLQTVNFVILNRMKQRQRVRNGKPAVIHDSSMDKRYRQRAQSQIDRDNLEVSAFGVRLGDNSFRQLTDQENDQFVYVY